LRVHCHAVRSHGLRSDASENAQRELHVEQNSRELSRH
jgi:hypothetical protein